MLHILGVARERVGNGHPAAYIRVKDSPFSSNLNRENLICLLFMRGGKVSYFNSRQWVCNKNAFHIMLGMKVYITDEKELIMEPSLKWAGNPNVEVVAKAFGLKATVQVIYFSYFCGKRSSKFIYGLSEWYDDFRWWIYKCSLHLVSHWNHLFPAFPALQKFVCLSWRR